MSANVSVIAAARLHMGFLDLSGALGRHFGSIGVALDEPATKIKIAAAECRTVENKRASRCLTMFCDAFNISENVKIDITHSIPEHVGLGSGTQMALAVGAGLNAFFNLNLSVREIAATLDRGLRSGIGIGIFEQGGLVVDGGRGEKTVTPPMLARFEIPNAWRFILVFDARGQGLHGQQEIQAFKTLPPFPRKEAERLSYLLLMQALPALAEQNLIGFGEIITELQQTVVRHFSPAQGGIFMSSDIEKAMCWFAENGAVAIGQTSWGPTGFCMVENEQITHSLITEAQTLFASTPLTFKCVTARNQAAEIVLQ